MCQDDYQYRHFSSIRDKICRRFIFINEQDDHRVYLVNIGQFQENGKIALCKILWYLSKKGLDTENYIYYLPKFKVLLDGQQPCYTDLQTLQDKQITFRMISRQKYEEGKHLEQMKQHQQQHVHQQQQIHQQQQNKKQALEDKQNKIEEEVHNQVQQTIQNKKTQENVKKVIKKTNNHKNHHIRPSSLQSQSISDPSMSYHNLSSTPQRDVNHKRMKQPQRVIGDVIFAVKKWRMLHDMQHMNLMNAAKIVGISKKSLDDYFLVLRMGQLCGFDYALNLEEKMGDLRHFIRNKDCKSQGRLPKELSQFKLFQCVKDPFQQTVMEVQ